jgi:hypothetical protein
MSNPSPSETLRSNERVKLLASITANAGSVLGGTAIGRWFLIGFDAFTFIWIVAAAMLIWSGVHVLTMLRAEDSG